MSNTAIAIALQEMIEQLDKVQLEVLQEIVRCFASQNGFKEGSYEPRGIGGGYNIFRCPIASGNEKGA